MPALERASERGLPSCGSRQNGFGRCPSRVGPFNSKRLYTQGGSSSYGKVTVQESHAGHGTLHHWLGLEPSQPEMSAKQKGHMYELELIQPLLLFDFFVPSKSKVNRVKSPDALEVFRNACPSYCHRCGVKPITGAQSVIGPSFSHPWRHSRHVCHNSFHFHQRHTYRGSSLFLRLGRRWSRRRLVDVISSARVVRRSRLLQRDVIVTAVVVPVVALIRVERLTGVLAGHGALLRGGVLRRRGLLVLLLVVAVELVLTEPAAAVLRLLLAVCVVGAAGHHPARAVAGVDTPPAAAAVRDTAPDDEEGEEEDDDDGG